MKIYQSLVVASLLYGSIATSGAIAAPLAETQVQLEKTAPIEADVAAPIDVTVQRSESDKILTAPGFEALKRKFEAILRPAIAPVSVSNFPIPPENFIYHQGGVGLASGQVNHAYFGGCFKANYGVLGGSSDRVLSPPVRATADSGVSPFLNDADIRRLQSLQFKFRYAFTGSHGSSLSLYLVNLTTQKTQFVGTLPTTNRLHPRCATVTQDLTRYIREPGVYGVRLVMVNRGWIKFPPYPQPYPLSYKAGEAPGDVIELGQGEPAVMLKDESAISPTDNVKSPPILPIFTRTKAVAGFDRVVVTVKRH